MCKMRLVVLLAILPGFASGGCATRQSAWRTDYSPNDYDMWTVTSPDAKFHVSVLKEKSERAGGWKWAAQYRFRHDECSQEIVRTWTQGEAPASTSYPIFTRVLPVAENLYLVLGWTADSVAHPQLYADLVKVEKDSMEVGSVCMDCEALGIRLVVLHEGLGLFVPNRTRRDYPWVLKVMGQSVTPDEFEKRAVATSGRDGFWYTRPALQGMDTGKGKVYWIDLKELAGRLDTITASGT